MTLMLPENSPKRTGWVVLAMLAVCILLFFVLFMFRDQLFGDQAKVEAKPDDGVFGRGSPVASDFALHVGLGSLAAGNSDSAAYFRAAKAKNGLSATDRAWAALLEGTAELNAGRPVPARAAFQSVPALAAQTGDPKLALFLMNLASAMNSDHAIPVSEAQNLDRTSYQSIAMLLYGLKDWQLGEFEDGGILLRQFRLSTPRGAAVWINELKGLVTPRIEQLSAFETQVAALRTATDASEREKVAVAFRKLVPPLSTRGLELVATASREANLSTLPPLSHGWRHTDFEKLPVPTEASIDATAGIFTIKTTSWDIFDREDSGHFVCKAVTGDFEIVARVVSVVDGNEWAKGGVMIRDGASANARNTFVAIAPKNGLTVQRRFSKGVDTIGTPPYWWRELTGSRWLKLVREGNQISAFQSGDGQQWTAVTEGDTFDSLPKQLLAGLAASSHDSARRTTATFDHVTIKRKSEPNYRILDLRSAATADNRVGLFMSPNDPDILHFLQLGRVTVHDVPFEILDPAQTSSGKSLIVLKGGLGNAQNYPRRVVVPGGGATVRALHLLSGIGAWAYPWGAASNKYVPAARMTIVDTHGARQEIVFRNGEEFADYVQRFDVPGSDFADDLTSTEQVRVIHVELPAPVELAELVIESFDNHIAPVFVAITAE
jgi:hypothetical protein